MNQLYNRYFPTPSYLMMKSFAIDISDQSIKYGELLHTSLGLRLGHFGKEKVSSGVIVNGCIQDEGQLVSVLRKIKEKENLNFVRVSLPEEQMYLFTLSLPKAHEKELREIILLQIEEHIPLKAVDTVFEYEVISSSNTSILVLVSAIAKSTVDSYLSVFKKAELTVLSFELEAQAIARAVISPEDNNHVMVVDFGDTRTGVSIIHHGKVFFTTTLDMGGINLTNMIAKNFSLSFEKAEEMKRSYGLEKISNVEDIFPVILNGISVLRDELNKQYEYWKNHDSYDVKNYEINRIILCGGAANLTGLAEYLEASMKIKVTHANAWMNISDMKISVPSMSFEESLSYVTILGLCLGEFSYNSGHIVNVLPEEEKKSLSIKYWKRLITIFVSFLVLVMVIFIFLLLPSYFFTLARQKTADFELDQFNLNNKSLTSQDLNETIKDINTKLALLSSSKQSYSLYDDVLGIILKQKMDGITFFQILINKRKDNVLIIEIHGKAKDRITLRNFKSSVDLNPSVASVDLPISNYLEKTDIAFTMSVTMK